ncbi:MAG: hypothetical protein A2252_06815 [Elusimicrobia bacterium RIFOXYA2_FULL_39_19]|nr:MAG: hypothetical protein A2252_06815 [Elusimicrobia bacterium RIFOXYA2_FULL_39_19]
MKRRGYYKLRIPEINLCGKNLLKLKEQEIPLSGFLIHISHYDPVWCPLKSKEKPFDLDSALKVVDAMSKIGMNMLVIDIADGVRYKSHPELARKYSVPISNLKKLADYARSKNIEVIPKLNFSQSSHSQHNHWFRPHHELFDNKEYWKLAFEVIDEIIKACGPVKYFHVGMDEDHSRAYSQYIDAIIQLRNGLKKRGLQTIIWNDSAYWHLAKAVIYAEKSVAAEKKIPKDIIHILWDYNRLQPGIIRRIVKQGFQVWVAPGANPERILKWKEILLHYKQKGMLMTIWIPCRKSNCSKVIKYIKTVGPLFTGKY